MSLLSTKRCHRLLRNWMANSVLSSSHWLAKISTSCTLHQSNYYESLGISRNSTQSEIKNAYYRLSKLYHPDKNQGSEEASLKFREINQAYEVLGNFRLRKLYDKGIIHTAGARYADRPQQSTVYNTPTQPEDDDETKFYKSRFTKSKVADQDGRTPIYNFDEWTRQHYGKTFERRQAAKAKYERTEAHRINSILMTQNEYLLLAIIVLSSVIYFQFIDEHNYDTPKERAYKAAEEKKNLEEKTNQT